MIRTDNTTRSAAQRSAWRALGSMCAAALCFVASAQAQVQSVVPDIDGYVDGFGVELYSGGLRLNAAEVAIGTPGAGGLVHSRSWIGTGWRDDLAGTVNSSGSVYTVSIGGVSETFTWTGSAFAHDQAMGSTLTFNGGTGVYTYTMRDGTEVLFDKALADVTNTTNFWSSNEGTVTQLTRPDGEVITWTYTSAAAGGQTGRRP